MEEKIQKGNVLSFFNKLSKNEKIELILSLLSSIKEKSSQDIPISIFDNDKLSTFEALVKYMRENLRLRFVNIASLLNRSDKTIWTTYNKTKNKMPMAFSSLEPDIDIPLPNFSDRKFTIFESLVVYLKDHKLTNHEIAVRLHRDDRTIWSVYNKAKNKLGK